MPDSTPIYAAFFSYSHAADGMLAPALERAVRVFGKKWYRRNAVRTFRDQTGLGVTSELWSTIRAALDGSRFLVLMASPESARSKWVAEEVAHWLDIRSVKDLIIVRTSGDIVWNDATADFDWTSTTALVPQLRAKFKEEPKWIDLAWAHNVEHLDVRDGRFADAVADIAARLHGVLKDEIAGEEVRQFQRFRRIRQAVIAALLVLVVLVGVATWSFWRQLIAARRNLARSLAAQAATAHERSEFDTALLRTAEAHAADPTEVPLSAVVLASAQGRRLLWQTSAPFEHFSGDFRLAPERDVVLGSAAGVLTLWKLPSGASIATLPQDGRAARGFAITPDGRVAVAELEDDSVRLFDVASPTPALLRRWKTDRAHAAVEIRRDAAFVAGDDGDGIVMWDARSGAEVVRVALDGWVGTRAMRFDTSGSLVVIDADGRLLDLDPAQRDVTRRRDRPRRGAEDGPVAVSRDGTRAAAIVRDGDRLVVWNTGSGRFVGGVRFGDESRLGPVEHLAFAPDGRSIGYTRAEGWLARIDLDRPRPGQPVTPGGTVTAIELLDGEHAVIAVANPDGSSADQPSTLRTVSLDTGWPSTAAGSDPAGATSVAFDPVGRFVATGGRDGMVRLWEAATGKPERVLEAHEDVVTGVRFTPDGSRLVSAGRDGTVAVWDPTAASTVAIERWQAPIIGGLEEHPVLAVGRDGLVGYKASEDFDPPLLHLRRIGGGESTDQTVPTPGVIAAALDDDSVLMATVTGGGEVQQWISDAGPVALERNDEMPDHVTRTSYVTGRTGLFVGTEDGRVAFVRSDRAPIELGSYRGPIAALTTATREAIGVSTDADALRVWDLSQSTPLATLPLPPGGVRDISLSGDGRRLAAVGADLRLRVWDVGGALGSLPLRKARSDERVQSAHAVGLGIVRESDGASTLVDIGRGATRARLGMHRPADVTFSADGSSLLVATERSGKVRVDAWDAVHGHRTGRVDGARTRPDAMGFSLDGGLAFVTRGPTVKLVELQSGRRRDMWRLPVLHPDQVLVGPEGRFVVARDVNGAVAASTEADTTVELAPAGRGRAVSASIDGVVLVSEAGTLRTFDVRTHAAPREIRSDARGLIACWLDLRRPTIACVAEGDRLVLLDARSGATILDYKAKPEAGSSAWRIEPPPVNGAMITMDAAQNGFESWDVGPALDVYDTLARLGPGARRDWVRTSLAHEAGR